jgi:hypothetical protein
MQRPLRTRIPRESAPQLLPSLSSSRTPPPLPHTSSTPDGGQARGLRWRMCSSLLCRPAAASFVPAACITRRKSSDGEPRSVQDRGGGGCGEWGDAGCGIKGRWRAGRRRLQRRGTTTTSGAASESSSTSSSLRRTRVNTPPLPSVALRRRAGVASPSPLRLELRRHGMGRKRRTLIESANLVRPGERTQCPPNAATTPGWRRRAPCSASVLRLLLPLPLLNRRRPAPSTPVGCLAARFALPSGARRRVSASQPAVAVCAPPHDSPAHGSVRPPSSSASSSTARSTPSLAGANRPRGYTTLLEVFLFCRTRPPSLSFAQHSDFADADPGDSRDGLCSLA